MNNYVLAECDDGVFRYKYWPMCTIRGCKNRVCLGKGSDKYCWPHLTNGRSLREIMDGSHFNSGSYANVK